MNPPATHYFVWYRVPGDADLARARIGAMQRDLASRTGVAGRLLTRSGAPPTWMEVYESVGDPAAFEAALADAVMRQDAVVLAPEGRHVESFTETR